ncbi:MAG: ribosome recycling factor [Ardenticatenaceae bacterium]|nr:ribosome recycling factor [Ardenticatenaceae bacterium]
MVNDIMDDAELRMMGAISALEGDLNSYRTGRASPTLLDRIVVHFYGTDMRLVELASISVPEPQQLAIKPYDQNAVSAIERAILTSDLGLNPNSDGKIIRLNIPPLTEERRRDLSRQVSHRVEEARVAIRNVRRDALNHLRQLQKDKEISEDEFYLAQDRLQELTDRYVEDADSHGKAKEQEIMTI